MKLHTALKRSQHGKAILKTNEYRIAVYQNYYASTFPIVAYVTAYTPNPVVLGSFGSTTIDGVLAQLAHVGIPADTKEWKSVHA